MSLLHWFSRYSPLTRSFSFSCLCFLFMSSFHCVQSSIFLSLASRNTISLGWAQDLLFSGQILIRERKITVDGHTRIINPNVHSARRLARHWQLRIGQREAPPPRRAMSRARAIAWSTRALRVHSSPPFVPPPSPPPELDKRTELWFPERIAYAR